MRTPYTIPDLRYRCVLLNGANPNVVDILDDTLLTAANYAGAGAWTTTPILASPSLGGTGYNSVVRVSSKKTAWAFGSSIKEIDIDPNSGTFGTVINTFTPTNYIASTNGSCAAYDFKRDVVIFQTGGGAILVIDAKTKTVKSIFSSGVSLGHGLSTYVGRDCGYIGWLDGIIHNDNNGGIIYDANTLSGVKNLTIAKFKKYPLHPIIHASSGQFFASDRYLFYQTSGTIYVYGRDLNKYGSSFTIPTQARVTKAAYNKKNNRIVTGSFFSNTFGFIDNADGSAPATGGTLAKGATEANESATREIQTNPKTDIAIAIPGSTGAHTFANIHVIDVSGKSYIGYLPMSTLIGQFSGGSTPLSYGMGLTC